MSELYAVKRAGKQCELCAAPGYPTEYTIPFSEGLPEEEATIALCERCLLEINKDPLNSDYWMCLQSSAWSSYAPVQAMAYRLLYRLGNVNWASSLLSDMFIEEDTKNWAQRAFDEDISATTDCNGNPLQAGDNVVVTKDLPVKGTSFVAKRGTTVRGIALTSNPTQIEGRVNGTRIVLLTKFVKKSS